MNQQIIFVRHSLGEKEVYATWSLAEVNKFELVPGLLTQELLIILNSKDTLRFATHEIPSKIKDWIETRKFAVSSKESISKPSTKIENKSTKKKDPSQNSPKKKSKRQTDQKDPTKRKVKQSVKQKTTPKNTSLDENEIRKRYYEQAEYDTSWDQDEKGIDNTTESFNDIANIFREMKNDLTSNQSSFGDSTNSNITHKINKSPSSFKEEDTEQKSCCSNWIIWLIVFVFLVQCLGS
jgi:hypothetical protein